MASKSGKKPTLVLFLKWLFARPIRCLSLVFFASLMSVFLIVGTWWPFFLAAECAAVGLGINLGWCLVKFDRSRLTGVKMDQDLDQMGFFNSRIAMRSPELFSITIADVDDVPDHAKTTARALVSKYWQPKTAATGMTPTFEKEESGDGK
jgi:hypothetical protein